MEKMNVFDIIQEAVLNGIKEIYALKLEPKYIVLKYTLKEYKGDITLVVFPLGSFCKEKPQIIAQKIGEYLKENLKIIKGYGIVKGFLNIMVDDMFWLKYLTKLAAQKQIKIKEKKQPQTIMVEYSSPNTNKPLHLGHIRNNLLGYAISEILKVRGNKVIKANLINDRGIHICKSMIAWQKFGNGQTPKSTQKKGDHFIGDFYVRFDKEYKKQIKELVDEQNMDEKEAAKQAPIIIEAQEMLKKWENNDLNVRELWTKMNEWAYEGFEETYKRMGVDFDKYYYESETYLIGKEIVKEGLKKGIFFKKEDNSVWIDLRDDNMDTKLLLRSDGTSVYITQDMGTAKIKYSDFGIQKSIYVVGNEQEYHFQVLKLILEKLGKDYAKTIEHLSYGMVDLPSGKMKSREGTVVDADDLMDQMSKTALKYINDSGKVKNMSKQEHEKLAEIIGLGALKYYLLKTDTKKRVLFNPEESIDFQGNTGPFIQYAHARIKSILRKNKNKLSYDIIENENIELAEIEKEIIKIIYKKNEILAEAEEKLDPSLIANYLFLLAKTFNRFYHEKTILKEENNQIRNIRLIISKTVADLIKYYAKLLGIEMPEKM